MYNQSYKAYIMQYLRYVYKANGPFYESYFIRLKR